MFNVYSSFYKINDFETNEIKFRVLIKNNNTGNSILIEESNITYIG